MTGQDNDTNKPKKLTLSGTLSLNKTGEKTIKAQTFVGLKSNTVVEVKKSKLSLNLNKTPSNEKLGLKFADDEAVNKKLNILKKAAADGRFAEEKEAKINTLTKLAAINQEQEIETNSQDGPDIITNAPSKIEQPIIQPVGLSDSQDIVDAQKISKIKPVDNKIIPVKAKIEEPKKLNKAKIFHMLDENAIQTKTRSLSSIRRAREKAKRKSEDTQDKIYREVIIPVSITVGELANRMSERSHDVIRELMKLGIMANIDHSLDADTAEIVATTLGHTVKRILESDVENILISLPDKSEDLRERPPVVTVMGHVDHGKTSLLDALKSSYVTAGEAGGITQHIGAYKVSVNPNQTITFIDTPGHEAFTAMRTRGAKITDIVILVVAADDGIKPQTIEAINHAKAANVPIIVAINKIDKPDINIEKVKNELLSYNLVSEELGGDTIIVPISAIKKINLDKLLDSVIVTAEMLELKANPNVPASGVVIESKLDKAQGVIATVLIQRGALKIGDLIVAGSSYGRVKRMKNDQGMDMQNAYPVDPVEIFGLNQAPSAGDKFDVIQTEKQARDITEYRNRLSKEIKNNLIPKISIENLFAQTFGANNIKKLPLIIKADVRGSIEAIEMSLLKIPNNEVKIKIIHSGVGEINESDVSLAEASGAIIIGFNTKANVSAANYAIKSKVEIRNYSIIYNLIDDIRLIVSGLLSPIIREQYIGAVEIRQVFNITKSGKIAGSYVTHGTIKRGANVRLMRDNVVIYTGKLKTLKRFKEDVKEVAENFECGIAFENYEDIKAGDKVEVFEMIHEKQKLL